MDPVLAHVTAQILLDYWTHHRKDGTAEGVAAYKNTPVLLGGHVLRTVQKCQEHKHATNPEVRCYLVTSDWFCVTKNHYARVAVRRIIDKNAREVWVCAQSWGPTGTDIKWVLWSIEWVNP